MLFSLIYCIIAFTCTCCFETDLLLCKFISGSLPALVDFSLASKKDSIRTFATHLVELYGELLLAEKPLERMSDEATCEYHIETGTY
jgi:hypothetical protein